MRGSRGADEELKRRALEALRRNQLPLGVGDVARELGVAWGTARYILLALALRGEVEIIRTAHGLYFRPSRRGEGLEDGS